MPVDIIELGIHELLYFLKSGALLWYLQINRLDEPSKFLIANRLQYPPSFFLLLFWSTCKHRQYLHQTFSIDHTSDAHLHETAQLLAIAISNPKQQCVGVAKFVCWLTIAAAWLFSCHDEFL